MNTESISQYYGVSFCHSCNPIPGIKITTGSGYGATDPDLTFRKRSDRCMNFNACRSLHRQYPRSSWWTGGRPRTPPHRPRSARLIRRYIAQYSIFNIRVERVKNTVNYDYGYNENIHFSSNRFWILIFFLQVGIYDTTALKTRLCGFP